MADNDLVMDALGILGSCISGCATVAAALVIAVAGGIISGLFGRRRDKENLEVQRISHALELSKLDLERKLKAREEKLKQPEAEGKLEQSLRPSILDFLANYRDLEELGILRPTELYLKIRKTRITSLNRQAEKREPEEND